MRYWLLAFLLANTVLLMVEFRYGAFEFDAIESDERSEQKQQASYSDNLKTQAESAGSLGLSPSPAAPAVKVEEKNNAAPEANRAMQEPVNARPAPTAGSLNETQGETGARTAVDSDTAIDKAGGADLSPAAPPVKPADERAADTAAEPSEEAMKESPESVVSPVSGSRETKNTGSEEKTVESASTESVSEKTKLKQEKPAAENPDKAGSAASPLQKELSAPEKKTVTKTVSSINADRAQTKVTNPDNQPKQDSVSSACYTAGPIKDDGAFHALLNRFRPQLKSLSLSPAKSGKSQKRISYVVYYPASSTMEGSLHNADVLKTEYGIRDLQIINEGELKGAISLGIFSNETNAQTAKSRLEQQGLEVKIAPRFPDNDIFYTVRLRWTEPQTRDARRLTDALTKNHSAKRAATCK